MRVEALGSSRSRIASPSRLDASTTRQIARPGNNDDPGRDQRQRRRGAGHHQAPGRRSAPGCRRRDSRARPPARSPGRDRRSAITSSGANVLGRMWRSMMRVSLQPDSARSLDEWRLTSAPACWHARCARRAARSAWRSAMMTLCSDGPSTVAIASASSSIGNASIASMTRCDERIEPAPEIARDDPERRADSDTERARTEDRPAARPAPVRSAATGCRGRSRVGAEPMGRDLAADKAPPDRPVGSNGARTARRLPRPSRCGEEQRARGAERLAPRMTRSGTPHVAATRGRRRSAASIGPDRRLVSAAVMRRPVRRCADRARHRADRRSGCRCTTMPASISTMPLGRGIVAVEDRRRPHIARGPAR